MTEFLDLTMQIDDDTRTFPGDPDAEVEQVATVEEDGYAAKRLSVPSHVSTHVDAPAHMVEAGATLDEVPIERLAGEAVTFDAREGDEVSLDTDALGRTDDVEMVFFWTGHSERAGEDGYYEEFPVVEEETAEALVERGVSVVGIDSFTPDDEPYPVHDTLLGNDILIVENLTNLGAVSGERFECYVMPLSVADSDGAPCRVLAMVE